MNFKQKVSVLNDEENLISDVIDGYFEIKNFLLQNTNFSQKEILEKKRQFLSNNINSFFEKHKDNEYLNLHEEKRIFLSKYENKEWVYLISSKGTINYPFSFVYLFDRLKNGNKIPLSPIDTTSLDIFMKNFDNKNGFDLFIEGFFDALKNIIIPLRPRESDVLSILTNIEFLKTNKEGTPRYHFPEIKEILESLGLRKKSILRVKRSLSLLYSFYICLPHYINFNPTKIGFVLVAIDSSKDFNNVPQELKKYIYWQIPFIEKNLTILCLPAGNASELLNDTNSDYFLKWYWNIDYSKYQAEYNDPLFAWNELQIPNLQQSQSFSNNYQKWDLDDPIRDKLTEVHIEIIKNLTKSSVLVDNNIARLTKKKSSTSIKNFLIKLIRNDVYQFYPLVNHVGLPYATGLRFKTGNKIIYENVKNALLSFPKVDILANDDQQYFVSSFHLPNHALTSFLNQLRSLKKIYQDKIDYDVSDPRYTPKLTRCMNLSKINFHYRDGLAFLNE
ncbi:MAG: hypothetical protein ACFFD1_11710 [Candidatus Thorarchaeota archaeon]